MNLYINSTMRQTSPRYDYELFPASDKLHSTCPLNPSLAILKPDDTVNFPKEFRISLAQLVTIAKIGILMNHRRLGLDRSTIIFTTLSPSLLSAVLFPIRQVIQSFKYASDIIASLEKCGRLHGVWKCI